VVLSDRLASRFKKGSAAKGMECRNKKSRAPGGVALGGDSTSRSAEDRRNWWVDWRILDFRSKILDLLFNPKSAIQNPK
jgi:hypothetical protein